MEGGKDLNVSFKTVWSILQVPSFKAKTVSNRLGWPMLHPVSHPEGRSILFVGKRSKPRAWKQTERLTHQRFSEEWTASGAKELVGRIERIVLTYTQYHVKIDSYWETAEQHRELSSVLRDDLDKWDEEWGGREVWEGGDICTHIADQSWMFTGRTDVEAETLILWPPDGKNWLTGKDPDAGKDWRQEEKGTTEDKMVGWHHRLNGHEFE